MKQVIKLFILLVCSTHSLNIKSQTSSPNLIIVTTDGLRWQEIFTGLDENLLGESIGDSEKSLVPTKPVSREELMPFTWNTFVKHGNLFGNRDHENYVNTKNFHRFSYPGYSEIFCGTFDPFVNSNEKKYNKNVSVLEEFNHYNLYRNHIAVFTSWELFPYILNQPRSGLRIDAGSIQANKDFTLSSLHSPAKIDPDPSATPKSETRSDDLTWQTAMEYTKVNHPKILYISLDDTDHYGHEGDYDAYAGAISQFDKYLEEMWNLIQSDPFYKDNTYFLITTDHGRGTSPTSWKKHGFLPLRSGEIWYMEYGPGILAKGEVTEPMQQYQASFAYKMAGYLNLNFTPHKLPLEQEPKSEVLFVSAKE
ncbi:MAG: alkaline phosphatase family protein [Saprospiraceae bacterium]